MITILQENWEPLVLTSPHCPISLANTGWHTPATELTDDAKAVVLNWTATRLRALGRLQEAVQPMQAGLDMRVKQEKWKHAANAASSLSELQLTRGAVADAITAAQQSVELADKSGDEFWRMVSRTTLADAQHQTGERANAQELFKRAKSLQKELQVEHPQLYSLPGYRYCDLLLTAGQWQEVQQRAEQALKDNESWYSLLSIALDQLSLGRASLQQAITSSSFPSLQRGNVPYPDTQASNEDSRSRNVETREDCSPTGGFALEKECQVFTTLNREKNHQIELKTSQPRLSLQSAESWLNQAVDGLRKAGQEQYLSLGLLARACYYRFCLTLVGSAECNETDQRDSTEIVGSAKLHRPYDVSLKLALADLQETHDIAQRGGMLLHLCDYHLESARLALTIDQPVFELTTKQHTQKAKQLIDDTGYKRRLPEVEYLKALL